MTIWCKHVHRLELQKFFYFVCRALTSYTRYKDEIPVFLIFDMVDRPAHSNWSDAGVTMWRWIESASTQTDVETLC